MNAGPELDALVAEKVMGWTTNTHSDTLKWFKPVPGLSIPVESPPDYSAEIAAAWEVVEKMRAENYFTLNDGELSGGEWAADFSNGEGGEVRAETAPHAICLAALKAVGAYPNGL